MNNLKDIAVALGFNVEETVSFLGYKSYDFKNIKLNKSDNIKTINQYINLSIDLLKTNIIQKLDKIKNNLKWKIRCFDEKIEMHKLIEKILLIFLELKEEYLMSLFPKDSQIIRRLKKINIRKCIIIEIYDNDKLIGMLNVNFDGFI